MIHLMGQLVAQDPLALGNLTKLSARRQVMAKTLIDFLLGNMYMRQNHWNWVQGQILDTKSTIRLYIYDTKVIRALAMSA